jgi:hypothetical protein
MRSCVRACAPHSITRSTFQARKGGQVTQEASTQDSVVPDSVGDYARDMGEEKDKVFEALLLMQVCLLPPLRSLPCHLRDPCIATYVILELPPV